MRGSPLGRGASAGVELPLSERDIPERVGRLCERFAPAEVVLAGDVLHAFESVPVGARETFDETERRVREVGARLVVTPDNHDTLLDTLWDGSTATEHRVGETVICHGDERPEASAERYVVGHDHPAIEIEGQRRPCCLFGRGVHPDEDADVLVLPAFNRFAPGVAVDDPRTNGFRSPLVDDLDAFRPIVRDEDADETLEFPPLGEFRELL